MVHSGDLLPKSEHQAIKLEVFRSCNAVMTVDCGEYTVAACLGLQQSTLLKVL